TDIFMPEMEGLETIQKIVKSRPNLPIIVMTGFIGTPFLQAALKFGASYGLYKPFQEHELLDTLNNALNNVEK
ncbi:MAG: response regulator, partial [bacterium]